MKTITPTILSLLCITLLIFSSGCKISNNVSQMPIAQVGSTISEEEMKKDFATLAYQNRVQTNTNVYDLYDNNGITPFTYPNEIGYKNGGKVLDFSVSPEYGVKKSTLQKGCIEIEYMIALWFYLSERNIPYQIDGIHFNFQVTDITGRWASWGALTRVYITHSDFQELVKDERLNNMTYEQKIKHMAKVWCEQNSYRRNGVKIQPYSAQ